MPHPQFTLKTMLWLIALVAAFFGGIDIGHKWAWKDAVRQAYLEDVETLRRLMNDPPHTNLQAPNYPADVAPIGPAVFVALSLAMLGAGAAAAVRSRHRALASRPRAQE